MPERDSYRKEVQKNLRTCQRWMRFQSLSADERIEECRAVLQENADHFEANYRLGRTLLEQRKDPISAEPYLRLATELRPNDLATRFPMARYWRSWSGGRRH